METRIYTPQTLSVGLPRIIVVIFMGVGAVFALLTCLMGALFTILPLLAGLPVGSLVGVALMIGGPLFGALFIGIGVWFNKQQPTGKERVMVTADAITYSDARGETTLRLSDIVELAGEWTPGHWGGRRGYRHYYPPYWTLVVKGRYAEEIRLTASAPRSGRLSLFDTLAILRDLTARLPGIPINPYLAEYAQTGTLRAPDTESE